MIFVPCINGLVILQLGNANFTQKLLITGLNAGPPTVTDGIVWTIDSNTGLLYGFSTSSGHQDYTFSLGPSSTSPAPLRATGGSSWPPPT